MGLSYAFAIWRWVGVKEGTLLSGVITRVVLSIFVMNIRIPSFVSYLWDVKFFFVFPKQVVGIVFLDNNQRNDAKYEGENMLLRRGAWSHDASWLHRFADLIIVIKEEIYLLTWPFSIEWQVEFHSRKHSRLNNLDQLNPDWIRKSCNHERR